MNFRLRSLLVRLTVAYGISLLLMIVMFTIGTSVLMRGLSSSLAARMNTAEIAIDSQMAILKIKPQELQQASAAIEEKVNVPGVIVIVAPDGNSPRFDRPFGPLPQPQQPGGWYERGGFDGRRQGPPPNEQPPIPGPDFQNIAPRLQMPNGWQQQHRQINRFDMILGSLLGVKPRHHLLPGGMVILQPHPSALGQPLNGFFVSLTLLGFILICVSAVIARVLTLRSLAPIQEVNLALAELATGNFTSSPVQVSKESEIGELAENYNRAVLRMMTAISEREQKENSMRQFIADASHELRTPLTVILGYVDALQKQAQNEKESFRRVAVIIQAEGRRMHRLIENLGLLTRLDQNAVTRIEIIDPSELVQEIVDALSILEPGRRFILELEPDALVTANREELYAAVRNIVENALKYAPEGAITIRTTIDVDVVIEVADEGPGISGDELPHLFDRFFRGEQQRGVVTGSGLGLPIAARAIQRAGGVISVHRRQPAGTAFRISLPRQHFS